MSKVTILLRLIKYTNKYRGKIILLICLGFISVAFGVLTPLPIKYIIDNVLSDHQLPESLKRFFNNFPGITNKTDLLVIFVSASIMMVILTSLLSFISSNITTKICQKLVHDFSSDLFDKLQKLSLSFYSKNNVGDLMQRMSADTYIIYSIVGGILLPTLLSLASLGSMFYVMYSINVQLALMAISIVPFFALLLYLFNKPMTNSTVYQYEISGKLWSFIQQSLSSVKIIQAYANEKFTRDKFKDHSIAYNEASVNSTKISMVYILLVGVVSGVGTAVVVGIGAYKGLTGVITTGELFLFISYIAALFGPVSSLAGIIATSFSITARARRIFEILDSKEVLEEKPDAVDLLNVTGHLELRDVAFGYGKKEEVQPILNDCNLEVEAGKMVAIVGPTGSGKTSLVSLLLRFYDPWEGGIYLDGKDLKDLKIDSLRKNITLVLQDSFIFPVSIADNISFGNPAASRDEIISAAKAAQAHEFISKLPDGYDTIPSEGGLSLSGGEKQRISIARAFLRNTPVLILDEPTSAMDVQTEAKIFKALSTYAAGKTVFIISHRLSTIRHADLIVSIKDGKIAEKGTHEALLKGGKVYAELHKFHHTAS